MSSVKDWTASVIKQAEIDKYLDRGKDFIDEEQIFADIEKYKNQLRGFYIDMNTEVPGPLLYTSEEVVDAILNIDQINEEYKERYEEFYKRFCCYDDGNASKHIVEEVFK